MRRIEVSRGGIFAASGIAMAATVGRFVTDGRYPSQWDLLWLALFVCAWLVLSAAAVNFDLSRWRE